MSLCAPHRNRYGRKDIVACYAKVMDRIDAMVAFVATADSGGFSSAARKLGRSPASMTRAVAFLEERIGTALLRRTTRVVKLTPAGERYLAACRRILGEIAAAEGVDDAEHAAPRGPITITAPASFGRIHVRPIVDAFLDAHPEVQARLSLLDRVVGLVDEGVDVAVRIAHLPDSALLATSVGEVSRVVCASPSYLAKRAKPKVPADLTEHACIAFLEVTPSDVWTFKGKSGDRARHVKVKPRLAVNSADAAIASAVEGHGITRVLSYQVARELREGELVRLLKPFEPDGLPVHVVYPAALAASPKVRAFVGAAVPRLRAALASVEVRRRERS